MGLNSAVVIAYISIICLLVAALLIIGAVLKLYKRVTMINTNLINTLDLVVTHLDGTPIKIDDETRLVIARMKWVSNGGRGNHTSGSQRSMVRRRDTARDNNI